MTHPDRFLLAGVMGWPVMHSRSPMLHNYWFAQHGLAGTYVPLAIRPEGLRAALRALPALGFSGCNLTIPHKEAALDIVDKGRSAGAAHRRDQLRHRRARRLARRHNNDGYGFIQNIRRSSPAGAPMPARSW